MTSFKNFTNRLKKNKLKKKERKNSILSIKNNIEELNDLYRVQHSLISETRKQVDEIKPGYGTNAASQNIFERLHLDVVQGHNPGGIPRENFEVNMGNNESGRKYDKDGNVWHHLGRGTYQKVNPKTGEPEGDKTKGSTLNLSEGDNAVVVNSETIAKALGIKPPAEDITSKIRVSEVKSGKGKSGTATIYGINAEGIIIEGHKNLPLINYLVRFSELKPGSAIMPFFGVEPY